MELKNLHDELRETENTQNLSPFFFLRLQSLWFITISEPFNCFYILAFWDKSAIIFPINNYS